MRNDNEMTEITATFANHPNPWPEGAERRALVLMSGGVDSSAAALLLLKRGFCVAGLTMDVANGGDSACESAANVCRALSIPHFCVNVARQFRARVSAPFCAAYKLGLTPNPCADCNERVKFGLLDELSRQRWGAGFRLATGHYARIAEHGGHACLATAACHQKDQSYFLAGVPRSIIERTLFPLGEFASKDKTRAFVREAGLPVADRPESMEICFADEKDYRAVIDAPGEPGPITDEAGRVIGRHNGIAGYTLGQRKGLGVSSPFPLFVTEIRPCDNTIVVAPRDGAFSHEVRAARVNLLAPELLANGPLRGKIRSQGEPAPCVMTSCSQDAMAVRFDEPVFAPAPGQRLVVYTEDGIVAAGGVISRAETGKN